jgi:hypothetical protein
VTLEDITCTSCGKHWDGGHWLLRFGDNPDPARNPLLSATCPGCQPEEDRFAVSVAEDIHRLPGTPGQ